MGYPCSLEKEREYSGYNKLFKKNTQKSSSIQE